MKRALFICGVTLPVLLSWDGRGQGTARFDQGAVFTVLEENDMAVRTDRHYTQGIKVSYVHRDGSLPGFLDWLDNLLPDWGYDKRVARFGLQVGQNIYTPADISIAELLPRDRPYAGWLYTGLILQRRGLSAGRWPTLESFEVQLGAIGPPSLGEQAQTWVHEVRDIDLPRGWDHQLEAEPGIELRYWRGARLAFSEVSERWLDVLPHAGASLGNVTTGLRIGGTLRAGLNLPDSFGVQTISSLLTPEGGWSPAEGSRWSVYVFTGIEGWLVGHNAFLDGNLYQESHAVSKEWLVGEWKSGFAVGFRYLEGGFAYVLRSREFRRQEKEHAYGSLFVKVRM